MPMVYDPPNVLLKPADWEVLRVLGNGRNMAQNIALEIDRSRGYINRRMRVLDDYGLVRMVGPAEETGLYEITEKGRLAYEHRAKYSDPEADFDQSLDDLLDTD